MKNILILLAVTFILIFGAFSPLGSAKYAVTKVVIDAGHGGKDPGALGAFSQEKDIALAIALKLGEIIEKYIDNVEVIYTRSDDRFVELIDRAGIANKNKADLFISIHCNATDNRKVQGTETFVMGLEKSEDNFDVAKRENSVILLEDDFEENYEGFDPTNPESMIMFQLFQNTYQKNSLKFAAKIEEQFQKRVGRYSRGVKQNIFVVLYKTSMPSVLIETGFISNEDEEKFLNDQLGQEYLASGIFRAFRDYKNEIEANN
ncbi:MAG: N-acetylmuramoyl-L-alanine amidase [Cyclobacteriaceae bacterium]|nr:N-acetylmuramoyl-L-alanine amidase [Cyclobacteriaceae bacterium]